MDLDQLDNFKRFQKLFDQVGLPLLRSIFVCRFIHSNDNVKGSEEWTSNRDFGSRLLEMIKNQSINHNYDGIENSNCTAKNNDNDKDSVTVNVNVNVNLKGHENDLYLSEAQKRLVSTGFVHKFDFHLLCILLTKLQFNNNNNDRLPKQFQMEQLQKWCMENRKIEQLASIFQHLTEVYGPTEKIPTTLFCPMWSMARSAMAHLGANTKEMNDIWAMSFNKPMQISNGARKKSVIPSHVSSDVGGGGGRVRSSSFGAASGPGPGSGSGQNWPRKSVIPSHVTEHMGGRRARSNSIGSAPGSPGPGAGSGFGQYPNQNPNVQHLPRKHHAIPTHVSSEGEGRVRSNSFGSSSVPPPCHSRSRRASTCSTDYYYISPTSNLTTEKSVGSPNPMDRKNTNSVPDPNLLLSAAFSKLSIPSNIKQQQVPRIRSPSISNSCNERSPLISNSSPCSSNLPIDNQLEDQLDGKFSMEKLFISCSVPVLLHGISLVIISCIFWMDSSQFDGGNVYISIIGICLGVFRILYCIPCIIMRRKSLKNHLMYIGLAHLGTGISLCMTLIAFLLTDFSGFHGESDNNNNNNAVSIALLIMLGIEPCISFFCLGLGICYLKFHYWRYI